MAVGTTTTTAAALKQYWHNFFLENLVDTLAMKGLTKQAKVGTGTGKVVWWVGIGKVNPVGAALSEGADPTARSSRASRISGTLAEYGNLIKNSTLFMDTALDGTKEQLMKDLARDAAKTMDDTVLAKALAGGTALLAGSVAARNSIAAANTATIAEIRKAVRLLQLSSVPRFPDGFYVGLLHPDVKNLLHLLLVTIVKKLSKLRETLFETIRSQAQLWEGSTTIMGAPLKIRMMG